MVICWIRIRLWRCMRLAEYRAHTGDRTPCVVVATASPFKFSADVLRALAGDAPADAFECAAELERRCGVAMPRPLSELKQLPERHNKVVDAQGMDGGRCSTRLQKKL